MTKAFPNSVIFDAAPTLEALKKLPVETKSRLLLARLSKIGAHDTSALNKHNLMMAADPYQMAHGYDPVENHPVRQHLLGAPWTRLVNEGYLADYGGQGFFTVTNEGREFLEPDSSPASSSNPTASATVPAPARIPARTPGVPRALLSYSWDSEEHKNWVLGLAERLQGESGVEILLDQWYLMPGDDRLHFMEQGVSQSDFVMVVCTPGYAQRADGRQGGVGYESMVITGKLADHILVNKFIPVLRDGSWTTSLPKYLKSRLGVDLSGNDYSDAQYELLLRVLHGELLQPPRVGPKPVFSSGTPSATSKVSPLGASPAKRSVLGPANKRPTAIVNAMYEKKGVNVPRESAFIRFWDQDGGQYSFENSRDEEHLGSKREAYDRFQRFQTDLIEAGYTRMQFGSNSDPLFSSL